MARLRPGEQFAGYQVVELIGSGGMGDVYRAEQPQLGRSVALKTIRSELAADEAFRRRFRREARLAASVDHPGVIPIYETGEAEGVLFLAMRWIEGIDLRQLIALEGPVEPERAVAMLEQLSDALDAAHESGLVHRDIKPANVLIEDNRLYISDFGLARLTAEGETTRPGGLVGTLDYLAPEVIGGKPASGHSDIYALGCLFYELLTGSAPYPVENVLAKLHAHATQPAPAPSRLQRELSNEMDRVTDGALAKEPGDRYTTARQFAASARRALDCQVARRSSVSLSGGVPVSDTVSRNVRSRRWIRRLAIGAVAAGIVAGAGLAVTHGSGAKRRIKAAAGVPERATKYLCGAPQHAKWSVQPVQACPLTAPLGPKNWVPVYARPITHRRSSVLPEPGAGWLHGTVGELFACQTQFPPDTYYHPQRSWFNDWWAYTLSDDDAWGWVPEVYFAGGDNDSPAGGLRHCSTRVAPDELPGHPESRD